MVTKRITRHNIEWRIRNLPYPINTYLISVDKAKTSIVIRTTNKKYFKEVHIPELSRCNLLPQQDALSIKHQHNTLIITVCIKCLLCKEENIENLLFGVFKMMFYLWLYYWRYLRRFGI